MPPSAAEAVEKRDVWQSLTPEERMVYGKLRELRNGMAAEEHVKPFVIFTNEQLAEMARRRVTTQEAMREIPEIGKSRLEKYCPRFLEALRNLFAEKKEGNETEAHDETAG